MMQASKNNIGISSSRTCEPERELQVPVSLGRISSSIDMLDKHINALNNRLRPVLRLEPCDPEPKCLSEPPRGDTVFDQLHSHSNRIERLSSQLEEMLRLLEV
jgi:hypothetical protein